MLKALVSPRVENLKGGGTTAETPEGGEVGGTTAKRGVTAAEGASRSPRGGPPPEEGMQHKIRRSNDRGATVETGEVRGATAEAED